jgi:hypothetical protein
VRDSPAERNDERVEVLGDGVAEALEGVDARVPGPGQPLFQRVQERQLKDEPERLLQEVVTSPTRSSEEPMIAS